MNADRLGKGWTFSDLAVEAGVSIPSVTRFLGGTHRSPTMAAKLAEALGHPTSRYVLDAQRGVTA